MVSHASNLVKHRNWLADRIIAFVEVGRENVIAGTDCGLAGRVYPQIVWAKLFLFEVSREILKADLKLEARN